VIALDEGKLAAFVDARIRALLTEHAASGWIRRDLAGVELRTLRAWVASGEVAASKIGRQVMVRISDVAAAIERRRLEAGGR
jgi:excisionase family DNA binding protein